MTTLHQDRLFEPPAHVSDDRLTDPVLHGPDLADAFHGIAEPTRQSRRLPDRILVAIHQACDIGALDIAQALLGVMNDVVREISPGSASASRRAIEGMVAAHHRLWHLRRGADAHVGPLAED